jgi:hypothetical protein
VSESRSGGPEEKRRSRLTSRRDATNNTVMVATVINPLQIDGSNVMLDAIKQGKARHVDGN